MGAEITISSKGQIAIPKDVRDRLGLKPGQKLTVTDSGGAIVLPPTPTHPTLTFGEATARLRDLIRYDGPTVTIEEMNETIAEGWIDMARRRDERSRS